MEDYIQFSAKTKSEAITKACIELGVSSDQLEIQVISEGSNGFFGIGSKPAVIKVRKIEPVSEEEEMKEIVETVKLDSFKEEAPVQEEKKTEAIKPVKKEIKEPKAVSEKPRQPKPVKERAAKEKQPREFREPKEKQVREKTAKPAKPVEILTDPEENKEVEKTIPLAAAHFEPSGLTFAKDHYPTISIPNPIPGLTFADDMVLTYLENGKWVPQTEDINKVVYDEKSGSYTTKVKHFSSYAMENKVTSKVSTENVVKSEILGQASCDNSENPKAVTGIALTYKEKSGWECKDADIKAAVEKALSGAKPETVNAMVAFFKTRLYSLMGSASGITETTRTYNTVNVNGYTTMTYTCYAKTRTTTLSTTVKYNNKDVKISVTATRYTGTDHQYKTVTTNPTHSGGKGGSN